MEGASGGGSTLRAQATTLAENTVWGCNETGVYIHAPESLTMYWNIIHGNSVGLRLENVSSATIWNNTFTHNTVQAVIGNGTGALSWDRGGYGNYWSDYTGVDSDGGGIGDTPYVISRDNIDHYPLLPHAKITSATLTLSGDQSILSVEALVSHPPGTWNLTVKTPTGEPLATRTFNITRTPYTIQATLELPAGESYTVHLATGNTSVVEKSVTSTSIPSTRPEQGEHSPTATLHGGSMEEEGEGRGALIAGLVAVAISAGAALALYIARIKK